MKHPHINTSAHQHVTFPHRGLYAIIDSEVHRDYGLARLFANIVNLSTIPVVQLRLKKISAATKLTLLKEITPLKGQRPLCLIINDDSEFLYHPLIDGLHIGQDDVDHLPANEDRPKKIIGVSTHDLTQARTAKNCGASYIGCGAVFATQTKNKTIILGLEGLRVIAEQSILPVVAIGGINAGNIADIAQTGCQMAAVITALTKGNRFCGQELHENFIKGTVLKGL